MDESGASLLEIFWTPIKVSALLSLCCSIAFYFFLFSTSLFHGLRLLVIGKQNIFYVPCLLSRRGLWRILKWNDSKKPLAPNATL